MLDLLNKKKQNEQQNNPGGMPTEQNQYIHRHLDGGPHRLQTCQLRYASTWGPRHYTTCIILMYVCKIQLLTWSNPS